MRTLRIVFAGAALVSASSVSLGAPVQPSPLAPDAPSLVEQVHNCHGSGNVQSDRYGPHFHAERCRRVDGYPPREPSERYYRRDRGGYDEYYEERRPRRYRRDRDWDYDYDPY